MSAHTDERSVARRRRRTTRPPPPRAPLATTRPPHRVPGRTSHRRPAHGGVSVWPRHSASGVVTLWLSVIVLLPLAALTVPRSTRGVAGLWRAITAPAALAALWVTVLVSALVALANAVLGTLVAWVLVRDDFRGKRVVNALIDLPFALPTIVASIVLLSLYGPNSPIGVQLNATRWGSSWRCCS